MTTKPSIALSTLIKLEWTVRNNLLNLNSSCWSTVFIDYSYLTGCFLAASSVSNGFGSFCKISLIFPLINA